MVTLSGRLTPMIVAVSAHPQHGTDLVLRPSFLRYVQAYASTTALLAVISLILFFRGGSVSTLIAVLLVAGGSGVASLYFRRACIAVTSDELVATGLIRRRRTPRASLGEVVTATMPRSHKASRTFPHVFVLDSEGRRVARLAGTHWLDDDMRRLIRTLGLPARSIGGVTTARKLAASHPRAISFLERRPLLKTLLVVVPALGAAAAVVVSST